MATIQSIRKRFGGYICRRCLNEQFDLRLSPEDCSYDQHALSVCPCCGEVQNIVTRVRFTKRLRLYLK